METDENNFELIKVREVNKEREAVEKRQVLKEK